MAPTNRPRNVSTRSSSGTLTTTGNSATTRNLAAANTSFERTNGEHPSSPMDCSTNLEGEGSDADVDPLTTDTDGSRRHRGPTRGLGIDKDVENHGRIAIVIDEEDGKPTDENANQLSSECGCIVRQFAPLQVQKWSKIPENDRKALFPYLLNKFDIDISAPHICKFLNHNMGRRYADYRYDLHLQYRESRSLAKAQAKFPNLSEEDWNYLCTHLFNTPEFQKLSANNAESRSRLQFLHRGGSRSFISRGPKPKKTPAKPPQQLQEPSQELHGPSQEQPKEPPKNDPIKLFHDKHWSEKKGWINEVAESKYDQMKALLEEQANKEESERLTKAQICEQVLGSRSGYVKGLGYGPKPKNSSSSMALLRRENEELHARLKEKDTVIETLQDQNKRLEKLEQNSSVWSRLEVFLRDKGIEIPDNV